MLEPGLIVGHKRRIFEFSVIHCRNGQIGIGCRYINGLVGAVAVANEGRTLPVPIDLIKQTRASGALYRYF